MIDHLFKPSYILDYHQESCTKPLVVNAEHYTALLDYVDSRGEMFRHCAT